MRHLHALQNLPWLCCGDFNETLHATEHFSEHPIDEWQMRNFREAVEDCEMQDLGFSHLPYTGIIGKKEEKMLKLGLIDLWAMQHSCSSFKWLR
jgi:hypothetical protein